jgi:hypothetical protein
MEKPASFTSDINAAARERSRIITERIESQIIDLEPKYLVQMAHLTTPATVWKYVEGAVTKSTANLVMLDLEDSIPRNNDELLSQGRANIIRAFNELDWGRRTPAQVLQTKGPRSRSGTRRHHRNRRRIGSQPRRTHLSQG